MIKKEGEKIAEKDYSNWLNVAKILLGIAVLAILGKEIGVGAVALLLALLIGTILAISNFLAKVGKRIFRQEQ